MPTSGIDIVQLRLAEITRQIEKNAETAMAEVMAALEGWAKVEHEWGNPYSKGYTPTGATANSIQGQVAEASAMLVRGVLSAGMDYDVFLELARDGKWAWLWPTIERHRDDILAIIEARMKL